MTKDTKIYQAASGGFRRVRAAVRSSFGRDSWGERWIAYRSHTDIDRDTHTDKEYTHMDKEAMCVYGVFVVLMSGLGASLATAAERAIGCDELLAVVSSLADFVQNRSQICTVARAWS